MRHVSRRQFLGTSLMALASGRLHGGEPDGTLLGTVPFVEEGGSPIGTLIEGSHEGRLVVDLATLTRDALVTDNDTFFIRTRYPDGLRVDGPWELAIRGHVSEERDLRVDELMKDVRPMGTQLLECSGNSKFRKFGLLSSAEWGGIPFARVLDYARPTTRAKRVLVTGHDEHSDVRTPRGRGASWVFSLDQLDQAGAFLATEMNGRPLPKDHGEPVRLIVPNWYGCTCIKWIDEIAFVDDDVPSTSQMREFAGRTHQDGVPEHARDFLPATMDQTGMVVRVEQWRDGSGLLVYRAWGVLWGGERTTDRFTIRFRDDLAPEPLESYEHVDNSVWTLWSHTFRPKAPGRYVISLGVDDPSIRTRRLDRGYYARQIDIEEI